MLPCTWRGRHSCPRTGWRRCWALSAGAELSSPVWSPSPSQPAQQPRRSLSSCCCSLHCIDRCDPVIPAFISASAEFPGLQVSRSTPTFSVCSTGAEWECTLHGPGVPGISHDRTVWARRQWYNAHWARFIFHCSVLMKKILNWKKYLQKSTYFH